MSGESEKNVPDPDREGPTPDSENEEADGSSAEGEGPDADELDKDPAYDPEGPVKGIKGG
jgi:hypothetical protein